MRHTSLWVFAGAFALLLLGNDRLILYSLDEARNAQCAREMYDRSDLVVPTYNGELRTQKPPLGYYAMMLSYALLGQTPFAARLPMAIAGALTVLLVFRAGRKFGGTASAGWWSAGSLLASVHFQLQMSMSVPDPYLILLVTAALLVFLRAYETQNRWQYALAYTLTGLAVLTKGPIGAWIIGAGMLLHVALHSGNFFKNVWKLYPLPGVLWVAALVAPWVLAVQAATDGAWLRDFIGYQNVTRFSEPLEGHGGFFGVTLAFVLVGMMPASAWLPQALRYAAKEIRTNRLLSLSLSAAVIVVGTFLVAATRLPNYTTPAYPFLALLVGTYVANHVSTCPRSWGISGAFSVLLAFAIPIGGYFGLKDNADVQHLASIAWLALAPAAIVLIGYIRLWRIPRQGMQAMVVGYLLVAAIGLGYLYPRIYHENPVTQSLPLIDKQLPVVSYKGFNPAYSFELPELVTVYGNPDALRQYLATVPAATVLTRGEHVEVLEALGLKKVYHGQDLFEFSSSAVLTWQRPLNQPLQSPIADGN